MRGEKCSRMLNIIAQQNSPYETRAEPKPVVKAEMRMLPAAAVERFGDETKAYICKTPPGIASPNISPILLIIIFGGVPVVKKKLSSVSSLQF